MTDPGAAVIARALQDMMARLAPHWGTTARTWDELGEDVPGQWCQHLVTSTVTELIAAGVIAPASRDALAHLARDWDAYAARLERSSNVIAHKAQAECWRECASQLRNLLGLPAENEQEGNG